MKKAICLLMALLMLFSAVSCGTSEKRTGSDDAQENRLRICTTLFPQYDMAKQIAGEHADVVLLLPPGVESHLYEPTAADISGILNSDIFIYTGRLSEAWASSVTDMIGEKPLIVDLSEGIDLTGVKEHSHEHEDEDHEEHEEGVIKGRDAAPDAHYWLDMQNAVIMVQEICEALCRTDPDSSDDYKQAAQKYTDELMRLDEEFSDAASAENKKVLVFGGRFACSHFVRRYDLDYISAYDSCSAQAEPSVARIAMIIEYIKSNGIKYVLHEELVDPKIARSISEQTGTELLEFNTAHNVSKEQFEAGVTFIDLMHKNVEVLKRGLE